MAIPLQIDTRTLRQQIADDVKIAWGGHKVHAQGWPRIDPVPAFGPWTVIEHEDIDIPEDRLTPVSVELTHRVSITHRFPWGDADEGLEDAKEERANQILDLLHAGQRYASDMYSYPMVRSISFNLDDASHRRYCELSLIFECNRVYDDDRRP